MKPTPRIRNDAARYKYLRKLRRYSLVIGLLSAIAYAPFCVRYGFGRGGGGFFLGAVCGFIGALPIRVKDPGSKTYDQAVDLSLMMLITGLLFSVADIIFEALRALGLL